MADNYVEIQVRANDGAKPDLAALKAALQDLNGETAEAKVGVDDTAADAKIAALKAELAGIGSPAIKPEVDLEDAEDKIKEFDEKLKDQADKAKEYASKIGEIAAKAGEESEKAGERESQARVAQLGASLEKLNQTLAKGAARATGELDKVVKDEGEKAGEEAGEKAAGGFSRSFLGRVSTTMSKGGFLRGLAGVKKDAEEEGEKSGEGFIGGFLGQNVGKLITGGITTALTMLPALAAGAGALAAVGLASVFLYKTNAGFKDAATSLKTTLTGVMTQAVQPMIKPLESAMKQLGSFVQQIGPQLKSVFSAVAPLIQPLVYGLEGLVGGILPGFISLMKAAKPAVQAVALILGELSASLGKMFTAMAPAVASSGKILGSLGPALLTILPAVAQLASSLANSLAPALPALIKGFGEFVKLLGGGIGRAVADLATGIAAIAKWAPPLIPALLGIVAAVKLWKIAQALLDIALDANPIGLLIIAVAGLIIIVVEIVKHSHDLAVAFDKVRHAAATLGHDIASVFDRIRHDIAAAIDDVVHFVEQHWKLLATILATVLLGPIGGLVVFIATHWAEFRRLTSELVDDVTHFFESLPGRIMSAVESLPGKMLSFGKDIVRGLIRGIESMAGTLRNAIIDLIPGPIRGVVEDLLGIASPSKVFHGYGQNIVQGLINGVDAGSPELKSAMTRMTHTVTAGRPSAGGLAGAGAGANGAPLKLEIGFSSGSEDLMMRALRQAIRVRGGNVQIVLGTGKA